MPPLQEDEGREAGGRKDEEARDRRGLRYAIRGDGQREEQAEDEHGERDETAPVDRRPSFELRHLPEPEVGPGRPENPDRDVHVEQRAPVEDGEDDPADGQSRHGPHPERDLVDPEGEAELLGRGRIDDHRGAVREQDRGSEALHRPERDDLGGVHGDAREEGAQREDAEAARVQLHPAGDVRDAPDQEERDRAPKDVRLGDPDRLLRVRMEARGDLREPDDHDARVEACHEHADGGDREDRPLVLDPDRLPSAHPRRCTLAAGSVDARPSRSNT